VCMPAYMRMCGRVCVCPLVRVCGGDNVQIFVSSLITFCRVRTSQALSHRKVNFISCCMCMKCT
jgi:hypothetical protein